MQTAQLSWYWQELADHFFSKVEIFIILDSKQNSHQLWSCAPEKG